MHVKWIKAPDELKALIDKLMVPVDCEKRPMFGYPAYFINGNLFAGLFQDKLFVRLSPDQLSAVKKTFPAIANLEPMPGRPMKAYHVIPQELYKDPRKMPRLLEEAAAWCRTLSARPSKPQPAKRAAPPKKGR